MEEINQSNKVPDEIIRQNIIDSLEKDPGIDTLHIKVEVKNGEVVLKGKIDTETEKLLSEKIARSIDGVSKVENHLHIDLGIVHALSSLAAHIQGDIIKNDDDDKENET